MRRCYKCGTKKKDDLMLCPKCEKELNERLKKQKHCDDMFGDYLDMPYQFDNMTGSMNL